MTTEPEVGSDESFVSSKLPWLLAAAGLAAYLVTLNRWVCFNNLGPVASISGWVWQPQLSRPLYWLLTYPFHWLPLKTVPLALNLFSAVCAALTLALLARSVALLPHDRTRAQRQRVRHPFALLSIRAAWLPPVLAVIICGLQLTFWEHATAASAEMLDLLLFAYVIRCLLEARLDEEGSWLTQAALVYGIGMANNWAMIGFFPAFIVALVWIKGLRFFNTRFLTRMFLWGVLGLTFYLLLPLVQSRADISQVPFWQGLKANLGGQKGVLSFFFHNAKQVILLLALTSLVPVFIIGIRWTSYFGDTSKLGAALANLAFHVVQGLFLIACVWVAFDPLSSPRNRGGGPPFLTFYYLGALSVGYFSGYFLLVFGPRASSRHFRPVTPMGSFLRRGVVGAVWLLLVLAPIGLLYRNLPQIRLTNGPMFLSYANQLTQSLPPQGVLLSDDFRRLLFAQSAAARADKLKDYLFLDSGSLVWTEYHRFLKKTYPKSWPTEPPKGRIEHIDALPLLQIVASLAASNSVYYLHPSFGYYFEAFYPEAHGLVYKFKPFGTNNLIVPAPSPQLITENEAFWDKTDSESLAAIIAGLGDRGPVKHLGSVEQLLAAAHLPKPANRDAAGLGAFYSQALDFWGVEMQRSGQLAQAGEHFKRAQELNPDNLVAGVNRECNQNLQADRKSSVQLSKSVEDAFGKYRNWEQVIGDNGPFDEPTFCYEQGRVFAQRGNYRQAAQQFARVKALAPDNLAARLWLAQLYIMGAMPREAIKLVDEIHQQESLLKVLQTNQSEILLVEASAHLAAKDLPGAEAAVQRITARYPEDPDLLGTATQAYMNYGQYTNALAAVERQLKLQTNNLNALVNKGFVLIQLNAFEQAIPPLTRALSLEKTNTSALLNRAIAYLRTDQFDAAQGDYEILQRTYTNAFQVYYGLGEIAYRKKDTNGAIQNYERYLTNAPSDTEEAKLVLARLKELKPGSP